MFFPPSVLIGEEKEWPEALGRELPLTKKDIATTAGISVKTFENIVSEKHKPFHRTISEISQQMSLLLGVEVSPPDVERFLSFIRSPRRRPRGPWELVFASGAGGERLHNSAPSFSYSRRLIVSQERAASWFLLQRKKVGELPALLEWLSDPSNEPYLNASFHEKDVNSLPLQELNVFVRQAFIRLHVSGIAAIEAENNSPCEQDPGPALQKYMPIMAAGKIVGPVSQFLTIVRDGFGVDSDEALCLQIAALGKPDDPGSWRRNFTRWRQTKPLHRGERSNLPSWKSILTILDRLSMGEERDGRLRSFAFVRYFQVLLGEILNAEEAEGAPADHQEIIRLFGEYEAWYRLHAERIAENKARIEARRGSR